VFRLNIAVEKEAAANAARDQVLKEMNEATVYDEPRNSSTRTSLSADETSYCEPESRSRELPPVPDEGATKHERISGVTFDEPQSDSGILLDISPPEAEASSYSGLKSSTREPPSPPQVYDELATPDYYNINAADIGVTSGIPMTELQVA